MNKSIHAYFAFGLIILLTACSGHPASTKKADFYTSLESTSATVDAGLARDMISAHRRINGLGSLVLDPALQEAAQREAKTMAEKDMPASADSIKQRLAQNGISHAEVNSSAGYRTLPEAFSGWRESNQHNRVMLSRNTTRLGIASAYAPNSKYKVYWVLIVTP